MRKIFFYPVCVLLLLLACAIGTAAEGEEELIHITDAEGLLQMAEDPHGSYVLDEDIDLAGIDWQPLHFYGTLDGNGHSIRNLHVTSFAPETAVTIDGNGIAYDTQVMAFFSVADHATIRSLRFEDACIRGEADDHAFIAIVAAVSDHAAFEELTITGSAGLYCGAKMAGVGGFVGFGSGSITHSEADITLVYVDTNKELKCEQFMGGAVAAGFMECKYLKVNINGYASVYGYAHCGGLIGMFRRHEKNIKENTVLRVTNNTSTGRITFFECNKDRRAYCKAIIGEKLNRYVKMNHNSEKGFHRTEIKKYDQILLPEGWE